MSDTTLQVAPCTKCGGRAWLVEVLSDWDGDRVRLACATLQCVSFRFIHLRVGIDVT